MDYNTHTQADQQKMLKTIGVSSLKDLFIDIPDKYKLKKMLDLPPALSEQEISEFVTALSKKNHLPKMILTGAGAYHHYIPAVVGHVISRSEFYTAYTPYQAEISQGILQAIYEYQTMIANLTGMQVANASMYDGASSMAEAAVLCVKTSRRNKIIMAKSIHPEYRETVKTYVETHHCDVVEIGFSQTGQFNVSEIEKALDENTAAVLVQSPNFFGVIENIASIEKMVHEKGVSLIVGFTEATSLGILKPAGEMGADLVVGEGQSFGIPLSYGGPYLGILASTDKFLRKIPGRLSGATLDKEGKRGFILTLQAREQHIRRELATSNICSNEALCMLAAAVYLVSLGKNLKPLAELNLHKAHYLQKRLSELKGWELVFKGPYYNEFVMRCPDAKAVNQALEKHDIQGGYEIGKVYPELKNCLLLCATEMLKKEDIEYVVDVIKKI
ncbi:MAG: aminomethyl-transferring glycine dehydrogenase subunit GcvPA [Gammaproteobacteria bacterium]|nr:aminomethyl-transferring glycine dehydrogenase subunit GcvPA [Gammaproteobacteria bacterium]